MPDDSPLVTTVLANPYGNGFEAGRYVAFPGLTPRVEIDGRAWIVRVQELAAVPGAELRDPVTSLAAERDALKRALDILIDGV